MNAPLPPTAAGFVTALGRVSLVLAALGVAWALAQWLLASLLTGAGLARLAQQPMVPPLPTWLLERLQTLSLAMLALAMLFLVVAWGLLKRHEWARLAFIGLLFAGALANFAGLAVIDPFFEGLQALVPASMAHTPDGQQFAAQLQSARRMTWITSVLGALAIAGLHGWVAWKLCTAPVRAEFGRRPT